jgi:hypothetical protein
VSLAALLAPLAAAAQPPAPTPVPPGTPVTIQVVPAPAPAPPVSITLGPRHGHVWPYREGCSHTGGGNIDVAQPSPDTVVITMTGVAVAVGTCCGPGVAGMDFDLNQCFEVVFDKPDVKAAKLSLEGRVVGLLRSHRLGGGTAEEARGCAAVLADKLPLVAVCVPEHGVAGGENLSINDREGPCSAVVVAGRYTLNQVFHLQASHPKTWLPCCKASSAEFAPDPALDPLWISYWEPFHGAAKKDFGFQITLRVTPTDEPPAEPKKPNNGPAAPEGKAAAPPPPAVRVLPANVPGPVGTGPQLPTPATRNRR